MKKAYSTPEVEKINFQYRDQVVVASSACVSRWENVGSNGCEDKPVWVEHVN